MVLADGATLRLEVPSGDVTLAPAAVDAVEIELVLRCSGALAPCRADAGKVELVTRERAGTVVVGVAGPASYGYAGRWHDRFFAGRSVTGCGRPFKPSRGSGIARGGWRLFVDVAVRYPRRHAVELLVGEGSARLERLDADAAVTVGEGSLTVSMPRRLVAAVDLRASKGQAALAGAERGALTGRKVRWAGEGRHRLEGRVDRGSLSVSLY